MESNFTSAISFLPDSVRYMLSGISEEIKNEAYEIRLRSGKCIVVEGAKGTYFVGKSRVSRIYSEDLYKLSADEISDSFNRLCRYSVYSHIDTISQCFVTLPSGHRVGICGTAVTDGERIVSVRDITSLNIRIAGEYKGCADELLKKVFKSELCNLIVAGPPSSGKTTLLRDMARQISGGSVGEYKKVAIVDERCEIAPVNGGEHLCDVGINTDVLSGFRKAEGILCAVRTLSPHLIVCDEIGTESECSAIKSALNSGVSFALTIHASSSEELKNKPQFISLISGGFDCKIVILGKKVCSIKEIFSSGENNVKVVTSASSGVGLCPYRQVG